MYDLSPFIIKPPICEVRSVESSQLETERQISEMVEYLNNIYYEIEEKFMVWETREKNEYLLKALQQYVEERQCTGKN